KDYLYRLSVRDGVKTKWSGTEEEWETAEAMLKEALESLNLPYKIGVGDAAFYGPKIDFQVRDAHRREFTNNTVQVDYQLPKKFELEYVAVDGARQHPRPRRKAGRLDARILREHGRHRGGGAPALRIQLDLDHRVLAPAQHVDDADGERPGDASKLELAARAVVRSDLPIPGAELACVKVRHGRHGVVRSEHLLAVMSVAG